LRDGEDSDEDFKRLWTVVCRVDMVSSAKKLRWLRAEAEMRKGRGIAERQRSLPGKGCAL
jgi:hypothetical protein